MKTKRTIKKRVLIDIFDIWDDKINGGVYIARDKLKKMFMTEYPFLKYEEIEEKRLILHNLTVAEIDIGKEKGLKIYEMESVKLYTSILKNEMDKVEGYKEGDTGFLYVGVLNNYTESHKKELTKKELIENYTTCYKIYEKYEKENEYGHLYKLIAKFNINLVKGNFSILLNILEELIHNNDDTEYKRSFNELERELKETNSLLYQRVSTLLKLNKKLEII